ncbi:MAG: TRAP transporter small permease, partial [Pseudomonadota bacterium]
GLIFGSYKQVFVNKFYRWEMFGTAFDPPIPATIQPMILIILALIALQAVANLIADWNLELDDAVPGKFEVDEEELKAIKRSVGAD